MKRIKLLILCNISLILFFNAIPTESQTMLAVEETNIKIIQANENHISSRSMDRRSGQNDTEMNRCEQVTEQVIEQVATEISQECIDLVKKYEGCKLTAYMNKGEKNYTIGYGHSGSDVKAGQTITQEEAERLLEADLKGFSELVKKHCEYLKLNQNELDSLTSFTYNTGFSNLKKLTADKTRTKEEIAEHITNYTKSASESNRNGLLKRRTEEKLMFEGGI